MVRFSFYVRYPASFFTVVDNLSRWSIHSHMHYYEYWIEKYGLTAQQKMLLEKYSVMRKKYRGGRIVQVFMYANTLEDSWIKLNTIMEADEVKCLKDVFSAFKSTFDEEWKGHGYLFRIKEALVKKIKLYDIGQIFKEVQHFYNIADFDQKIDVHLLYNPAKKAFGGGAHAGVQMEIRPDESENAINRNLAAFLHEAFHIMVPSRQIEEELIKFNIKHDEAEIVREAVMGSLVPDGIIAKKYLQIDGEESLKRQVESLQKRRRTLKDEIEQKHILNLLLRKKLTLALLPLTKMYIKQGKAVQDNYWSKVIELYFQIKNSVSK